jgi:hypothetical protein
MVISSFVMSTSPFNAGSYNSMCNPIRLRLDANDVIDLIQGRVLFKEESGAPRGTGPSFEAGKHPVQICLTESDRQLLGSVLKIASNAAPPFSA